MMALVPLAFVLLLVLRPTSVHAGLRFLAPSRLRPWRSPRCVTYGIKVPALLTPLEGALVVPSSDICDGGPAAVARYGGKMINRNELLEACGISGTFFHELSETYRIGVEANVSAILRLYTHRDDRFKVADIGYYLYGQVIEGTTPFVACEFIEDEGGSKADPDWMREIVRKSHNSSEVEVFVSLTTDANPWQSVFDNPLYQVTFRVLGLAFLWTGAMAAEGLRRRITTRMSPNKVPETLLLLEAIFDPILGSVLVVGCWFGNDRLGPEIQFALASFFSGVGFASSLLAGVFFQDMKETVFLAGGGVGTFWSRNRIRIVASVGTCILFDIVGNTSSILQLKTLKNACLAVAVVGQGIVGVIYVRSAGGFINLTSSSLMAANSKSSTAQLAAMRWLSKWLLVSGVGMMLYCVVLPIMFVSGKLFPGIWGPYGWWGIFSIAIAVRIVPSFAQVNMSWKKQKKKKKRVVGMSDSHMSSTNSQGSSVSGSKGVSFVSSSAGVTRSTGGSTESTVSGSTKSSSIDTGTE